MIYNIPVSKEDFKDVEYDFDIEEKIFTSGRYLNFEKNGLWNYRIGKTLITKNWSTIKKEYFSFTIDSTINYKFNKINPEKIEFVTSYSVNNIYVSNKEKIRNFSFNSIFKDINKQFDSILVNSLESYNIILEDKKYIISEFVSKTGKDTFRNFLFVSELNGSEFVSVWSVCKFNDYSKLSFDFLELVQSLKVKEVDVYNPFSKIDTITLINDYSIKIDDLLNTKDG